MTTTMTVMSAATGAAAAAAASASVAPATRPLFIGGSKFPSPLSCRTISRTRREIIGCQVALKFDSSIESEEEEAELKSNLEKVGRKVRVKAPLKVYHIPKLPEFELRPDMIGVIKQYVGFWKGKRISPNLPFKVEFIVEIEGRGLVKFVSHLKEDEFHVVDQ